MADLHIDEFFGDAARALLTLYSVFPRPVALYVEDVCGPDDPDEYGVHSVRHQACFATLIWLGEEGYLRYADTIRQEAIDQAVLTARCFAALHADAGASADVGEHLPASVRRRRSSCVYQLQQAVHAHSSSTIEIAFTILLDRMA